MSTETKIFADLYARQGQAKKGTIDIANPI